MTPTFLSLFSGLGGATLGFIRAGWRCVGAVDHDEAVARDHAMLTGVEPFVGDIGQLMPQDLRARFERPNALVTSPPCQGNSACLPAAVAAQPEYQALNDLALWGVWLTLEAWADDPPEFVLLENVPRITVRSRPLLDQLAGLLRGYGYASRETVHDCGELGGLSQRRRRFLLIARRIERVPEFVYEPPRRAVQPISAVLGALPVPVPGSAGGGPMHRLPRLSGRNWLRLALIPPGGDWRDLPAAVRLPPRDGRQNGGFGVEAWDAPSHAVLGRTETRSTWGSVADPRLTCEPRAGVYGVVGHAPTGAVVGASRADNGAFAVADPRVAEHPERHAGGHGVEGWDGTAHTVTGARVERGWQSVADPRVECQRREGAVGVTSWDAPSTAIIGQGSVHNGPWQVADPRLNHEPRRGSGGVQAWGEPAHTVIGQAGRDKGASVAEPRAVMPTHALARDEDGVARLVGPPIDLDAKGHLIIRALDGTWHRPMTTLELAALQALPVGADGSWLCLDGRSHGEWRKRIGNAVPPPTAEAIARTIGESWEASRGRRLLLSGWPVWVTPPSVDGAR